MQNTFNMRPTYNIVKRDDIFECSVLRDINIISNGKGTSKKKSEQDASRNALIKYGVIN
jgi:dsRNA-specific ribonuclease